MHSDPLQRPDARYLSSWTPGSASHSTSVDVHGGGNSVLAPSHPARGLLQLSAGNRVPDSNIVSGTSGTKSRQGSAGSKENRRKGIEQKGVKKGSSAASMLPLTKLFG
jgi:hypothetical protein